MKNFIKIFLITFIIYFFSWYIVDAVDFNDLAIQSEDTIPAIFLPLTIIKENTLNLDTYYKMMLNRYPHPDDKSYEKGLVPFYIKKVDAHYVSAFPIITPLLALPVYYAADFFVTDYPWEVLAILSHLSGALIMATAAAFFYFLVAKYLKQPLKESLILTLVYSLATVNFALVSQGLWLHGTVQLFLIIALIYFVRYKETAKQIDLVFFGFFMSIAVLSRPTAILVFAICALYVVLSKDIKRMAAQAFYVFLGTILPLLFFVWYNSKYYLSIQNQGYSSQLFKNWLGDFPLSFFGVWLSPSKGILIYSPVLIFALIGIYIFYKKRMGLQVPVSMLILVVFLHTLVISFWKHWFGGWSFGYRMSTDILPFLVLLIIPWFSAVSSKKQWQVFICSIFLSVLIELGGIVFFDGIWHAAYDRGFQDTSWLWSIKDSEATFNIRRVLVKLGYLDRACPQCEPGI